ncbi:fructokinase ScrK [Lentilactobacillus hilgardii]|uniref:Fructokinase n=2 Tax=Lactobacillaceae TaxID=33958 RepID=C0XI18_LENH9|nr:fructokinase ScrK [Lentilactobacillus hilgardii]EEI21032.1 ROK family protein [Lentilactobacillus buchneri ATCC 11577]SOT79930.1 ROK family protein [Levilactobacillus brevis subsp. gravesensis]EEI24956.1 ROK family protein [Lentilactobacillus hilgardii DSM 20176 = ATCC 8290]KRK56378.1 branched chain amino acid 2-keto-4-methylthiobutyrate aminotransferase fructokinase [Lentilactobacillus hilgardii DSM 20176 = ATCC 8290]MCP9332629.1 ROK family protein [Lentilactobacillus hilgardii]
MLLGSIEAGGTKFVCAVGNEDYRIIDSVHIKTTTPEETLQKTVDYFKQFKDLQAIAVSSFGPIELRKNSPKYGYITNTPKPGWANTDFVGRLKEDFDLPISWTTDVNGSAYGEYVMATLFNEKIESLVYFTIGTGVGAGEIVNGHFVGDLGHPEVGHVRLKRHPDDMDFKGICPYHGDCLEGLVSGPTFEARTGKKGQDIPLTDHVWDIMAFYVAQAAIQETLLFRPAKIVFGGGVVSEPFLKKVRAQFKDLLNDYVDVGDLDKYIVMPLVKNNGSATVGDFALAVEELNK